MAITKKDIEKLTEHFATKGDLEKFATKEDLAGEIGSLRKEILAGQDKIMGELEKAREDRVFAMEKDRKQDKRLDDLEERVGKVEVKVG